MSQQPSPEVAQLGERIREFGVGIKGLQFCAVWAACAGIFALGLSRGFGDTTDQDYIQRTIIAAVVIIALFVIAAVYVFIRWLQKRSRRVIVFSKGILSIQGDQTETYSWDAVDELWWKALEIDATRRSPVPINFYKYVLRCTDGRELVLDNALDHIRDLGAMVENAVRAAQLPRFIEAIDRGNTISFGKLRVSRSGIDNGKEVLPWPEVQSIEYDANRLYVRKRGKRLGWFNGETSKIANPMTLVALSNHMTSPQS